MPEVRVLKPSFARSMRMLVRSMDGQLRVKSCLAEAAWFRLEAGQFVPAAAGVEAMSSAARAPKSLIRAAPVT